jgi:hypothetical protein
MATKTSGYSPRWLYAILNWIRRTPLGGWLLAIVWIVGLAALYHWRAWQMGLVPQGELHRYLLGIGFWNVGTVFMILSLDRIAETSLREFGALGAKNQKEIQRLTYNFISIPEKEFMLAFVVGLVLYAPLAFLTYPVSMPGLFTIFPVLTISILILIQAILLPLLMYRSYKQLRSVQRLYRELPQVSLFNLAPIYALSRYTSWIPIFLVFLSVGGGLLVAPEAIVFAIPTYAAIAIFGLLVFLLPLRDIQQRLRREKARMVTELSLQIEVIHKKVQQAVNQNKLGKLGELRTAASTLKEEMDFVQKLATWPWNPGTLRNLLIPILLPLLLAIAQRYVLTWLGL